MRLVSDTGSIGAEELAIELDALGLTLGDAVYVEADMDALGPLVGGPCAVIEALLATVGQQGLVMMPAFSSDALMPAVPEGSDWAARERAEACVPGFDPARSPANLAGPLGEAFLAWPGVERSCHPVYSIAAAGMGAAEAVAQHPRDWAMGTDGPMGRLLEQTSPKVLQLGTGWTRSAGLTMAETMGRHRRLRVIRFKDNARSPARWVHARDTVEDDGVLFAEVGHAFEQTGAVTAGPVARTTAKLCRLDDLLAFAAPTIALSNFRNGAASPHVSVPPANDSAPVTAAMPVCRRDRGLPLRP